ncbi:hypothetical protein HZA26_02545 [Candidatus Nomurabacteria bacterium]|nr:hypothetical protein [Candidatus Nomurabacteria bacterium]
MTHLTKGDMHSVMCGVVDLFRVARLILLMGFVFSTSYADNQRRPVPLAFNTPFDFYFDFARDPKNTFLNFEAIALSQPESKIRVLTFQTSAEITKDIFIEQTINTAELIDAAWFNKISPRNSDGTLGLDKIQIQELFSRLYQKYKDIWGLVVKPRRTFFWKERQKANEEAAVALKSWINSYVYSFENLVFTKILFFHATEETLQLLVNDLLGEQKQSLTISPIDILEILERNGRRLSEKSLERVLLQFLKYNDLTVMEYAVCQFTKKFDSDPRSIEDLNLVEQVFISAFNFLNNPMYERGKKTPLEMRVRKKIFHLLRKLYPTVKELHKNGSRVSKINPEMLVRIAFTEDDPENVLEFWPYLEADIKDELLFKWFQDHEQGQLLLQAAGRRKQDNPQVGDIVNELIIASKTHRDTKKRILAIQALRRMLHTDSELVAPFFQDILDLLIGHYKNPRNSEIQEAALMACEGYLL